MLWLVAVVPLLAAGYVALLKHRAEHAGPIGRMLIGGAGRRERLLRSAPPVLMLLAVLSAIFATARPTATVTLPSRQQTAILAMDVSLSMRARDIEPNRFEAAKAAAKAFVQELPPEMRVGIVSFAGTASLVQPPTRNREDAIAAIDRFEMQRATATGSALLVSLAAIFPDHDIDVTSAVFGSPRKREGPQREGGAREPGDRDRPVAKEKGTKEFEPVPPGSYKSAVIVLLSDGRRTTGADPIEAARAAADRGVRVYTVGFGTASGAEVDLGGYSIYMRLDEEALKAMAEITKGEYFYASSAGDLHKAYADLSSRLVLERADTEISALFAALAALLAIASGGFSVAWFGRIA
jgi:Ca-activated chloride channel family protein